MNVVPFGLCQVQEGGLVDDADAKGTVIQPAVVSLVNQSSLSNGRHSSEASALAPLAADPQQLSAASADPTTPRGKVASGAQLALRVVHSLAPCPCTGMLSAPHQETRSIQEKACTTRLNRSVETAMSSRRAAATSIMASKTIPSLVSIMRPRVWNERDGMTAFELFDKAVDRPLCY